METVENDVGHPNETASMCRRSYTHTLQVPRAALISKNLKSCFTVFSTGCDWNFYTTFTYIKWRVTVTGRRFPLVLCQLTHLISMSFS
jgi:hypothetical protein